MKKRMILLLVALLGLTLLLVSCGGGAGGNDHTGDDGRLTKLVILADDLATSKSTSLGQRASIYVTTEPSRPTTDHTGATAFDAKRLCAYVHLTEQNTYVRLEGEYPSFYYPEVTTTEDMVFYLCYCTHDEAHFNGAGDLVSEGLRLSCATFVAKNAEELKTALDYRYTADRSVSFALGADIDLGGEEWSPIDYNCGTIWGMGHTISNFKITATAKNNLGFFGTLTGTVRDLNFENVTITTRGEGQNVGILAGTMKNMSVDKDGVRGVFIGRAINVTVNGTVNASHYTNVGGLIGYSENGEVTGCKSLATVSGNTGVGGICGHQTVNTNAALQIDANGAFVNCINEGAVSGKNNVGGLAGTLVTATGEVTLTGLVNNGQIGGTTKVGGVFGEVQGIATLSELKNNGVVEGARLGDSVGGIAGATTNVTNISYCKNLADITGGTYVGGLVGYAPAANIQTDGIANNSVIAGVSYVGGFAGYAGVIEYAVNNAEVVLLAKPSSGEARIGGIAGYCTGILYCINNADISVAYDGSCVGGLVGYLAVGITNGVATNVNNGSVCAIGTRVGGIAGCVTTPAGVDYKVSENENNGTVSGKSYVGGIFGELVAGAGTTVSLMTNKGEVTGELDGERVGGIIGGATTLAKISACDNRADVTGGTYVGGLIGYASDTNIKASGFPNVVAVSGVSYVGGFAGYAGFIEDAVNNGVIEVLDATVSGNACIGGIAGYCTALVNCENNADITLERNGDCVGGLAGMVHLLYPNMFVDNVNNGKIVSAGSYVGGIAGRVTSPVPTWCANAIFEITKSKNTNDVSGKSAVGGIVGSVEGNHYFYNPTIGTWYNYYVYFVIKTCTNEGVITGESYVGGIIGNGDTWLNNRDFLADTNTTLEGEYYGTASN